VKQAAASSSTSGPKPSPLSCSPQQQQSPSPQGMNSMSGLHSTPYQHEQPQLPTTFSGTAPAAQHSFSIITAPAPPQHYSPPQQLQWAPPYEAQSPLTMRQLELSPTAYSAPPQHLQPSNPYYQAPDQPQAQHAHAPQYNGPPTMYADAQAAGAPDLADTSADPMSIVERMMLNLKRATQLGRPD